MFAVIIAFGYFWRSLQ